MVLGVNLVLSFSSCFSHQVKLKHCWFHCVHNTNSQLGDQGSPPFTTETNGFQVSPLGFGESKLAAVRTALPKRPGLLSNPQDGSEEQTDVSWPSIKQPESCFFLVDQISLRNSEAHATSHKEPQQLSRMHLQEKEEKRSSLNIDMPSLWLP